ncbi:hypothetical protein NL676_027003 [Syzygium grande]|nr:hypothetical protein NL676_027003 [Syzygium grande]
MTAGQVQEQIRHLPSSWKSNDREPTKAVDIGDLHSEAHYADLVVAFMEVDDVASMLVHSSRKSLTLKALVSPTHSNPGRKPLRIMLCQRDPSQKKSQQTSFVLKILDPSISSASLQMKVIGEEEDGRENEDDRDEESGDTGNTEEPDNTEKEMDLNDVPEREQDMGTEEGEDGGGGGGGGGGGSDGNGRVFKIINVLNNSIEDEIASLKLSEFSGYGPFVEAVHAEWVKLTGRTPQPEVDIVKPWPNFDTLYCDADGNPLDIEVKWLRWEEFRKVASCVRMFHHLVKIYLIEDNQAKEAVGEADLRPLGSTRILHMSCTLSGQEFKYELCFIRVEMMDGGPSEDEENMETAVSKEEEGVSIYLALPFPSSQGKQIFEVGKVCVFELASYEDLARALHKAWVQCTGRNASPHVVDVEKSWPGYRVTLFAQDDSGLCNHPIGITNMDWVAFTETLYSIQVEPVDKMDSTDGGTSGSVGDEFEDYGETEDGGGNGNGNGGGGD